MSSYFLGSWIHACYDCVHAPQLFTSWVLSTFMLSKAKRKLIWGLGFRRSIIIMNSRCINLITPHLGKNISYSIAFLKVRCTMYSSKFWRRFLHSITMLFIDFFVLDMLVTRFTAIFASSSTTIFATPIFFAITSPCRKADNSAMILLAKSNLLENPITQFPKASRISPPPPASPRC